MQACDCISTINLRFSLVLIMTFVRPCSRSCLMILNKSLLQAFTVVIVIPCTVEHNSQSAYILEISCPAAIINNLDNHVLT